MSTGTGLDGSAMAAGYTFEDEQALVLGSPILGDEVLTAVRVQLPLSRVNRHGLIVGATRRRAGPSG